MAEKKIKKREREQKTKPIKKKSFGITRENFYFSCFPDDIQASFKSFNRPGGDFCFDFG